MEEENKKTPEELKRDNNMNFAKAMSSEIGNIDKMTGKKKQISTDTIQSALDSSSSNVSTLQQQSEYMRLINGILKEIQIYKSNVLTYDHFLVPIDASKYKGKQDKFFKDMRKAALELEKYNIKTLCPWLIEQQLRLGEIYIYKQAGDNDVTFFKMPNEMCKITHSKSFINGYSIKLTYITDKTLKYYPMDIQKLYNKYKNGQLKKDKNLVDGWYKLDISKAVAFTPEILESKGVPYYSGLLMDLSRIKDLSDLNMDNAETDNFKLLWQKLPSDENGDISIDFDVAYQYHQAVKNSVPLGIGVVSTPYPIESVTLTNNANKNYEYLTSLKDSIYNASGVDSSLFNNQNRSTSQSIIYSAIIDTLFPKNLLDRIKIWLNYDFSNNTILKNFRIMFCDTSKYDKAEKVAAMASRITTWASKLEYLAIQGYSPLDGLNILELESYVDFDEMMSPLMTSHTATSAEEDNGRPSADKATDDPNKASTEGEN